MISSLCIVGVGLLGGSVALAARQRHPHLHIIGVDLVPSTREFILNTRMVDQATEQLVEGVQAVDLVVFCTPVDLIADQVATASGVCRPETVMIDVGSTKTTLVRRIEVQLNDPSWFLGCHPLAGSEKSGAWNSSSNLFQERLVVLTPTARTQPKALELTRNFWQSLGAYVRLMSPEQHDKAVGMTSHLPHLIASALAGVLPADLFELAATGFRDTTRIAAGSAQLWTKILSDNRIATLAALDRFQSQLDLFANSLRNNDGAILMELLQQGKEVRDNLGHFKLPRLP